MARAPFYFSFRDGEGGFNSDIDVIFFSSWKGGGDGSEAADLQKACRRRSERGGFSTWRKQLGML